MKLKVGKNINFKNLSREIFFIMVEEHSFIHNKSLNHKPCFCMEYKVVKSIFKHKFHTLSR